MSAASIPTSFSGTVTSSSQVLTGDIANIDGDVTFYRFISTVACWVAQGTADAPPVAVASGAGCMLVPANTPEVIAGGRAKLAVIRQGGSDGICCITKISQV